MTITLEQVEKLREKANVSYEDAKIALEKADGDLLDALIMLEQEGKTSAQPGGFYSTSSAAYRQAIDCKRAENRANCREGFRNFFAHVGSFLTKAVTIGSNNYLDVSKDGQQVLSVPIIAFVLLLIMAFWGIIPLMVIGLFFRYRYQIRGKELGNEKVNQVLDRTADAVQQPIEK